MKQRFMDNDNWLTEFRKGNALAFRYIFDTYNKRLYYYADQYLDNREEAEDIVADTFRKLWEKCAEFDSLEHIAGFLHITTRNACINKSRHNQRKEDVHRELVYLSDEISPDLLNDMIEGELLQKIYVAVEALPKKCKQIFKLSFQEGLTTKEIAGVLGISERNVLNQKNRAIQLLKSQLLLLAVFFLYAYYLVISHLPAY